jgi:transketolase C-terminal domain/subunit
VAASPATVFPRGKGTFPSGATICLNGNQTHRCQLERRLLYLAANRKFNIPREREARHEGRSVLCHSRGQSERVANRIAADLREQRVDVDVVNVKDLRGPIDWSRYQSAFVVAFARRPSRER